MYLELPPDITPPLREVSCRKLLVALPLLQVVVVLSVLRPSIEVSEQALATRRRSMKFVGFPNVYVLLLYNISYQDIKTPTVNGLGAKT